MRDASGSTLVMMATTFSCARRSVAVLMLSENMCSPMLARFARWAKAHGVPALPTHKLKMTLADAMSADIVIDESAIWTKMDDSFEVIGDVTDDDVYFSELE